MLLYVSFVMMATFVKYHVRVLCVLWCVCLWYGEEWSGPCEGVC